MPARSSLVTSSSTGSGTSSRLSGSLRAVLATNAMVHANTAFSVTLAAMDETVVLTVRDRSLRFPTRRPTQVMATRGRGLDIVDFVALEWGINDDAAGSKAVWASFAIRAATEN